jgi:hypothetical protein
VIQIKQWEKGRILSASEAKRLLHSKAEPRSVLETAMALIVASKGTQPYEGSGHVFKKFANVTSEEAWLGLKQAEVKQAKLDTVLVKRTHEKLNAMKTAGLLTQKECDTLVRHAREKSYEEALSFADGLISEKALRGVKVPLPSKSDKIYEGEGKGSLWQKDLKKPVDLQRHEQSLKDREGQQISEYLEAVVSNGLIQTKEAIRIRELCQSLKEVQGLVQAVIEKKKSQADLIPRQKQAKRYDQQGATKERILLSKTEEPEFSPDKIAQVVKWAQVQMNEGTTGYALDQLLESRFSPPILKAASKHIKSVRTAHEGAAGHLYVDTEVYASKKGTSGCDKGGLVHRANQIKFALAMERCGSCVFKNREGHCQKYNKALIDEMPTGITKYKKEMIRLANAHDAEATASMFNNPVEEFDLDNETLENIDLIDSSHEELGDVLFGGFELGEEK